jgi:peroxiredoxin
MARTHVIPVLLSSLIGVAVLVFLLVDRLIGVSSGLSPGDMLPAAELQTVAGQVTDTRSWRGSPTLLVLFLPTCNACNQEIQGLAEISASFPEVNMILISLETPVYQCGLPFAVYVDPSGDFIRRIKKRIVPTLYGIDREGRIAFTRVGKRSLKEEKALLAWLAGRSR